MPVYTRFVEDNLTALIRGDAGAVASAGDAGGAARIQRPAAGPRRMPS